jgi:hypothetical protein
MLRSHAPALAALAVLLASTAPSAAQTPAAGAQCVPAVANPQMYGNCRIAVAAGAATCRCEVRPQALRQPARLEASRAQSLPEAAPASTPRAASSEGYLSPAEIRQMYSGRTWMWSEGGGYFDPSGSFHAAVGDSATTAFLARGTWSAGAQGELCFSALWNGQIGKNDERTCFYHKAEGGKILQRKGQTGEWYAFRNAPGRASDEYNKLVQGNRIGTKMGDLRARLLYGVAM